jgi:alkylated DNA repair protein (DNA oxidative demethylase)
VSDAQGYRYAARDPLTNLPWPAMPECFLALARSAAAEAGFADFLPEACLINQYVPGAKLSLHQDRDEKDLGAPIVSLSLGLPAVFLFGGTRRNQRPQRYRLAHGDVVVWGGPARLAFHGVAPLEEGEHALLGQRRINLTFRRVRPV